ncbi:MAG: DedA family protein [Halobacteriota archaeon]
MLALEVNVVETLSHFVITAIEQLGYAGVFVAMGLESACIPLPSEVIMPFAGYVAWEGTLTLLGVAVAGTLGCLAGSLVAYYVGAYGGRPLLDRYGRYILIRKSELDRAHTWFERHGEITVFVSRVLPIVRTFISLPAGIARMDIKKFSIYTLLGSFPWCLALAYVGFFLGPHWSDVEQLFRYLDIVVVAGLVAVIGYLVYHREHITSRIRDR